jgi:hypothetical protein
MARSRVRPKGCKRGTARPRKMKKGSVPVKKRQNALS